MVALQAKYNISFLDLKKEEVNSCSPAIFQWKKILQSFSGPENTQKYGARAWSEPRGPMDSQANGGVLGVRSPPTR